MVDVIASITTIVRAVTGVRTAPGLPPDQISMYPAVVVYPAKGSTESKDYGLGPVFHDVVCEVFVPRVDLARDMEKLLPFVDGIPKGISTDTTLNAVYGATSRISYVLFHETYGATDVIGYRFLIEKIKLDPYGK